MKNNSRLSRQALSLLIFSIFCSIAVHAQQPQTYYVYKHQRIELPLNGSSVALQYRMKKTPARQLADAAAVGVAGTSARSLAVPSWEALDMQIPFSTANEADNQIKKLTSLPSVDFVSPVFRGNNNSPIIITPDILVQLKSEYIADAPSLLRTIAADADIVTENFGNMKGAFKLHSRFKSGFDVLATANRLVEGGYAEWSEPDMIITGRGELTPNDPLFPKLWGIHNTGQFGGTPGTDMKGDLAWNITTGDTSVKVMVIDCGVQQDHPDIHQRPGIDFTGQGGGGGPVNSCDNHGTAVAGCVSAIINNGVGVVGIAPTCYVISARTLIANSSCNNTFTSQISWTVNALAYAGSNGIRITNFSNQFFTGPSSALEAEYQYTHDSLNVVHFAAAGNGSTSIYYPASIPVVNAVAALNSTGSLASFSNRGVGLDFSAPGDSIYTTDRTGSAGFTSGDYVNYRGTSFASPYVAGVAALILSRFPTFTATQVEQKLQNSCVDLGTPGYDLTYGWGFVNAYNAIRSSCIIIPPANITTSVDPGQCGAIVNFPTPVTTGNCSPVTCTPASGSFFPVGTTVVTCADTSAAQCIFTVTVTGGSIASGILRDDFNRPDSPLPGTNKWTVLQNQPAGGSMAVVNNAMQPTSTSGNLNFGGVVWDSLMGAGTEASITVTQKSGNTNNSSLFIYARMNTKDNNTGTGYRLRFWEQSGADLIEIHRVGPGYSAYTVLASTNVEINPGDVITFRVLCDNKAMVGLVNGVQVVSATDGSYMPTQWYFAMRACVFQTPVRFDNFKVSSQPSGPPPPPTAPTLLSPANNSTNQAATLVLGWNASAGATSYRLQLSADSLFSSFVVNDSTLTTTSRSVGTLANNTLYYWRVNAKNSSGTSVYSTRWSFTTVPPPPLTPVLLSPPDGATNQPTTLTLSWNPSTGATTYRLQVSSDSLFASLIVNDSTLATTFRSVGPLLTNTAYFWRVNAKNNFGTSSYSSRWSFTTVPPLPPPVPTLLSPADGSINQATTLTLSWNPSTGANTYRLQVSTDSLFGSFVVDDSTLTLTSRSVGPLPNSTSCYWRVNAKNTSGTSAFSSRWSFTTTAPPPPPAVPVLLSPADASPNQPTTLILTWNPSSGATTYRIQVSTDSLFGSFAVDDSTLTGTSRTIGSLLNTTIYYWRVNAKNTLGTSGFSMRWSFSTLPPPPPAPTLLMPPNNSTGRPIALNCLWNKSLGATTYRFQLGTDSLLTNKIADDSTLTDTTRQVSSLANNTKYYWRVSSKNIGGASVFGVSWNFTTIISVPGIPALQSPANGTACQPATLTMSWSSVTGAATYRLQVAVDSLFGSNVVDDSSLATPSKQISSLASGTTYYWRVRAANVAGSSAYSTTWNFKTFLTGVLRDDFNRANGQLAGSNKWALILNQPSSGAVVIAGNMIQASSSAGNYNFGGVVWDTLMSAGTEASITLKQKSGDFNYTSLFIYAKLNNKDYNTGTGYRLRYFEQSGTDKLEIHRVGIGYANSTVLASTNVELNINDVLTFRVLCDNQTLVGYLNGVQVITATDAMYMPSQWYFAIRGCVFPTPVRYDDFKVSSQAPPLAFAQPFVSDEMQSQNGDTRPKSFALEQNYPNPFNPTTMINYALPVDAHVTIRIFNILGQEVKSLVDEMQNAGYKFVTFDSGTLTSGVYFYRLVAQPEEGRNGSTSSAPFMSQRKMLLVR